MTPIGPRHSRPDRQFMKSFLELVQPADLLKTSQLPLEAIRVPSVDELVAAASMYVALPTLIVYFALQR